MVEVMIEGRISEKKVGQMSKAPVVLLLGVREAKCGRRQIRYACGHYHGSLALRSWVGHLETNLRRRPHLFQGGR